MSDREALVDLYRGMVRIRLCELELAKAHQEGLVHGACHTYVGQEAVAVGVCAHLRRDDVIFSTHRGHGHAMAKGVPPREIMAELFGRATGCSSGRGGSMHLFAPEVGLMGTTGIVGPNILQAAGAGYTFKLLRQDRVSVAFFGDGAVQNGAFHEGLNLASIWKLPVIFTGRRASTCHTSSVPSWKCVFGSTVMMRLCVLATNATCPPTGASAGRPMALDFGPASGRCNNGFSREPSARTRLRIDTLPEGDSTTATRPSLSGPLISVTAGCLPAARTFFFSSDGRRTARIPPTGSGYTSCPFSSLMSSSASGPSIVGRSGASARMTAFVLVKPPRANARINAADVLMARSSLGGPEWW